MLIAHNRNAKHTRNEIIAMCSFVLCICMMVAALQHVSADPAHTSASNTLSHALASSDTLSFQQITIEDAQTHTQIADLTKGEIPKLSCGVTYALNVSYTIPSALQFKPSYLKAYLGDGLYVTALPGATFEEGAIDSTSFDTLIKAPQGTNTSPYGYPEKNTEKSRNGEFIYKTKNPLTRIDTKSEIRFRVDDAYVNENADQILVSAIKLSLHTDPNDASQGVDTRSYNVCAQDKIGYGFWVEQSTEVISKGGTTEKLVVGNAGGGKSLTEKNSKTTVDVVYPKDIELVDVEETTVYKTKGTLVKRVEEGENFRATLSWDEAGSYSGGCTFKPHFKVPANSTRANGSSFEAVFKYFKKTIWNDTPNSDRTSGVQEAKLKVTIIDGEIPEKITTRALEEKPSNWAYKKYDTYNVRLGACLIKNELSSPTLPKTLEILPDTTHTAIVRGVTLPYHKDMQYKTLEWKSSDGKSGVIDLEKNPDILKKSGVSALITNTALGLNIDTSLTYIKLDMGVIPGDYDGIRPQEDILENIWNTDKYYLYDEYYGWGHIPCGIYGSWKKGTCADIVSQVKLYTTTKVPSDKETFTTTAKSQVPKILNGKGTIDKNQINGGESFTIAGVINDGNWDWNPLQEPVLYVIMPQGFSYSDLNVQDGTKPLSLGAPSFVGTFNKDGNDIKVWKYVLDVGNETRGQYQPDFSIKSMKLSMKVATNKLAAKGVYHINDFIGITTKDFADIKAEVKAEKWDRANWNTKKYTNVFGDKVNSGADMVSLAEQTGVTVNQASEIAAVSSFYKQDGKTHTEQAYVYDVNKQKATTVVLTKDTTARLHIDVRNNAAVDASSTKLFVPLLSSADDFGASFTPEGATQLPLKVLTTHSSSNFKVKYIKLKDGVSYDRNHAPQEADYEVVDTMDKANMLMFESLKPLAVNEGGSVDVVYAAADTVGARFNGKRSVLSPVLDYDISGNHSTLTLETHAMTYEGVDEPQPPAPHPAPEPQPNPPQPTPQPTPTPTPQPVPVPQPEPTPVPQPSPIPTPEDTPENTPTLKPARPNERPHTPRVQTPTIPQTGDVYTGLSLMGIAGATLVVLARKCRR